MGFLSEWDRYVRLVEASQWREGKIDLGKMSGALLLPRSRD